MVNYLLPEGNHISCSTVNKTIQRFNATGMVDRGLQRTNNRFR